MAKKKLTFYTVRLDQANAPTTYIGKCRELPTLTYGPKDTRDAASSGIRRLAARELKSGKKFAAPPIAQTLNPAAPAPVAKQKVNRIAFVVDRSGSMQGVMARAIQALEDNIRTIRAEAKRTGQKAEITVISFDTTISRILVAQDVNSFLSVPREDLTARGSTALFDAVGEAINTLEKTPVGPDEDVAYLVITITDGEENASSFFTSASLKTLMGRVQATDRWTLTFLLPPYSKSKFVSSFGIPEGNVTEWEGTSAGVQRYAQLNNVGTQSYFSSRALGQNSVKAFYTDLSGLTSKQVKTQLDDLSNQVRSFTVDREQDIKSFVEGKLGYYRPGSAFYQLTKDEKKVQDYKQLLVMEKGKRSVYGGADARSVLGIPDGDLKVKPGNHGNFDIFVQSTSLNRKLVRGTKLLVLDSAGNQPVLATGVTSSQVRARSKKYPGSKY